MCDMLEDFVRARLSLLPLNGQATSFKFSRISEVSCMVYAPLVDCMLTLSRHPRQVFR